MLIHCYLNKVRDVQIVTKPEAFAVTGPLMTTPILKVFFEKGEVDPFAEYYAASRQPRVYGPHHAFANVTTDEEIGPFFKQYGFPAFEGGRPLFVGDVLIEAKRFRLLMEAWGAFRVRDLSIARERLGELTFALDFRASWFYWPPSALFQDTNEQRLGLEAQRNLLRWEQERATERAARFATTAAVHQALIEATWSTCVRPLEQVQFSPEIGPADGGRIDIHWALRPLRFLGESEVEGVGILHEEAYIGAPYALMFLLDQSAGIETRVCADPYCRQLFGAGRRGQMYHSADCGHRVAVRRYRERQRSGRRRPHRRGKR